jgi:AraC-like DNA-binding protein
VASRDVEEPLVFDPACTDTGDDGVRVSGAITTRGMRALQQHAILAYIRRNLSRRITLAEIASVSGMSVFQLCRAVQRDWQITPHRLVLELRLEHASRLIRDGAPIAEAAYSAGFADQSHLTRHFRRARGTTPKRFAMSCR